MKGLSFFGKTIFFFNSIVALLLLASYVLPYVPPSIFPALSVLSLLLPVLLILNILFFLYWLVRGKRQLLLSGVIIALGITHMVSLFKISSTTGGNGSNTLKVMTYNVRQFNTKGWSEEVKIGERILDFINSQDPDVVCLQEYHPRFALSTINYPYRYEEMRNKSETFGQVIFSKYPILNKKSLNFKNTGNNLMYADIATPTDTLRVYNAHFQSFRLSPSLNNLQKENSKRLLGRLGAAFKKQEEQAEIFIKSEEASPHPVLIAGDFNNSATSYMYRKVKGDKVDAFAKAGSGLGTTFWFDKIPLRIDFILADDTLPVIAYETFETPLSDHYPSMATFNIK